MGTLVLAKENVIVALDTLEQALLFVEKMKALGEKKASVLMDNKELERTLRDSLIQRFEFCSDLFWKYIKKYEEEELKIIPEANAPRQVILTACKANIISEIDAEILLEMIKSRNFTLHIYKEEIADQISAKIPGYYQVMKKYVEKLKIQS